MASSYPAAIDVLVNPTAVDNLNTATKIHHDQHANVNDAVEAIETELGVNPRGASATVGARMAVIEAALAAKADDSQVGVPAAGPIPGIATLDGGGKVVQDSDAARISSGTLVVARIPNLSGAKILGTVGGGAVIPVDAVPSLPASQIGSGTFNTARIPSLDGAIIGTGTIAAARLPSSVTSNANARVVNDLAGRNAILPADRVDGMLVLQKDIMRLWAYRADNDTFACVSTNVQHGFLAAAVNTPLNAVWGDVTGLQFNAIAGETYGIECTCFASNPSTSSVDIRYGWTWSGTGDMDSGQQGPDITVNSPNTTGTGQFGAVLADAASPLQPTQAQGGLGTPSGLVVVIRVYATYRCTTAGLVKLQHIQDTTSATLASVTNKGSRLRAERLVV